MFIFIQKFGLFLLPKYFNGIQASKRTRVNAFRVNCVAITIIKMNRRTFVTSNSESLLNLANQKCFEFDQKL